MRTSDQKGQFEYQSRGLAGLRAWLQTRDQRTKKSGTHPLDDTKKFLVPDAHGC
jgi:hypothetical protein